VDLLEPVRAFDRLQRRVPALAIPVAVLRNFSDSGAGNAAALIAWWGFFSVFPLYLLFVSILGFVLQGHPGVAHTLVNSALKQFPIVGADLSQLKGSSLALGLGLLGTVWSGLGVTVAIENAFNVVYAVPHREQGDFFMRRVRGAKLLVTVGVLQLLATGVSGLVGAGLGSGLLPAAGVVIALLLDLALFTVSFRFLTPSVVSMRELWPGILIATAGWELLQTLGGTYIRHVVKGDTQTYGTFAELIGMLAWLYLGARVVVFAAEINVTLTRRLWPRSLMDPPEPSDRRARAMLAKMEERDDKETVEVTFHPPAARAPRPLGHAPYAVAPEPAPGEPAPPALPATAEVDIHTMTFERLLQALSDGLDGLELSEPARVRARAWLREAAEAVVERRGDARGEMAVAAGGGGREREREGAVDREAAAALAAAAERALGLAPPAAG
jgi:membrane protein